MGEVMEKSSLLFLVELHQFNIVLMVEQRFKPQAHLMQSQPDLML